MTEDSGHSWEVNTRLHGEALGRTDAAERLLTRHDARACALRGLWAPGGEHRGVSGAGRARPAASRRRALVRRHGARRRGAAAAAPPRGLSAGRRRCRWPAVEAARRRPAAALGVRGRRPDRSARSSAAGAGSGSTPSAPARSSGCSDDLWWRGRRRDRRGRRLARPRPRAWAWLRPRAPPRARAPHPPAWCWWRRRSRRPPARPDRRAWTGRRGS